MTQSLQLHDRELAALGAQLDESFERARTAALAIIEFGALLRTFEAKVVLSRENNSATRGPSAKGTGLKAAVERWCKKVSYKQAWKYATLSDAIQNRFELQSPEQLLALCAGADLPRKLVRTREELIAFATGKSLAGLQLELGLFDRAPRDPKKPTPKPTITAEKLTAHARAELSGAAELLRQLLLTDNMTRYLSDDERRTFNKNVEAILDRWRKANGIEAD